MKGGFNITTNENYFNLIDEPWIVVRNQDEKIQEVSLKEVLLNSQNYISLEGESGPQNAAVFRLLLALTNTVISRYQPDGECDPLKDSDQAYARWAEIWNQGKLPAQPFAEYLQKYYDRFWLFSDERPFMQTRTAEKGTFYKSGKLVGTLAESSNKLRLFQMRNGVDKDELNPSESARWLINLNGFDDTSAKASAWYRNNVSDKKSMGAGWLGKLGLIFAEGENLFQTLMLNTILVAPDGNLYKEDLPFWEIDHPDLSERREIKLPDNLAALYTLPSRRIYLDRNQKGKVTGYYVFGGDFFPKENAFIEPFTLWRKTRAAKGQPENQVPARHTPGRQFWRDFGNIVTLDDKDRPRQPGIIRWIEDLEEEDLLPEDYPITFVAPTVYYGDKDFFVQDLSSQNFTMYASLLKNTGLDWRNQIEEQIKKIDKLAFFSGLLAKEIAQAGGKSGDSLSRDLNDGEAVAYRMADKPFRQWISSLNPSGNPSVPGAQELYDAEEAWNKQARRIAGEIKNRILKESGASQNLNALLGRKVEADKSSKSKDGKELTYYSSIPEAIMRFSKRVNDLYPKQEEQTEEHDG